MSNASRCRARAAQFARLAEKSPEMRERLAYRKLERLWLEMEPLAENFDRDPDGSAKQRIYEIIGAVEAVQRKVA
ncbi:MAG TPA: hypothetical protein VGA77_15180 [Propylenella sp.]